MYWYWFIFNCSYGTLNYSSIHVVSQEMHPSFNLTFTSVMMSKLCVYSCSDTRVVQESCQCCVPVMRMDAAHAALCVCIAICAQGNPLKHILALTWIRCVSVLPSAWISMCVISLEQPGVFPSCSVSAWSRQSSVYVWDLRWHHTSVLKSSSLPKIKTGDSFVSLSLSCLYFFGIQQKVKTTKIIKSMHHFSVAFAIVLAH